MTPISKRPITFRWKQVIQYMTSITGDSVEQITVPILYYIRYVSYNRGKRETRKDKTRTLFSLGAQNNIFILVLIFVIF